MSLIKVYGAAICKDCLAFLELKETHKLDWVKNYYRAEDYHQNYLDVNPTGYCHVRLETFARIKELN